MYIETVPNRNSRPAILLREGWREGPRTRKRTLANLSHWPPAQIQALRAVLKGDYHLLTPPPAFSIERTRPHGHVAATVGTLHQLRLEPLIAATRCPERDAVAAMIVARVVEPRSKLATARQLRSATLASTLGELLDLTDCDEELLYRAMDWLLPRQDQIEQALAKRHLSEGTLALYDLTSTYFEGHCCPLARYGYSRDGKRDKLQITFGLLTNAEGCPVAVEVFAGNTADPATVGSVIAKLRQRFALTRIVLVGDRGMITSARIRDDLLPAGGLDWITALRAPQIQQLLEGGALQLSLFDDKDLAEISDPSYPGERLVACRNPLLAQQRARKRSELLAASERALNQIVAATQRPRNPLRGKARIALRVGSVLGRYKMRKHFRLTIEEDGFSFVCDHVSIAHEAALDGIYVIRTSVPPGRSPLMRRYRPISAWPRSSRPSAVLSRSTSKSGPFTIASRSGYGRTSCCACSPTMSSGTCAKRSLQCCSMTTIPPPLRLRVLRSSLQRNVPPALSARPLPNSPRITPHYTASTLY